MNLIRTETSIRSIENNKLMFFHCTLTYYPSPHNCKYTKLNNIISFFRETLKEEVSEILLSPSVEVSLKLDLAIKLLEEKGYKLEFDINKEKSK